MAHEPSQSRSARVIALSPGDPYDHDHPWRELAGRFECVFVCSPYEAAAEILCGGVAAMVIDLNLMARRHGDLLEIARQADVRVLGSGAIPAGLSSGDLKGVYLVDRVDLLSELQRVMPRPAPIDDPPLVEAQEPLIEPVADEPEAVAPPSEEQPPAPPPPQTVEVPARPVAATEWPDEQLSADEIDRIVNVGADNPPPGAPVNPAPSRPAEPPTSSRPTGWASLLDDELLA